MLPLPPPVFSGNTPISPDFTNPNMKDLSQQVVNSTLQQGSASHVSPGVVLAKDSLSVPLEVLMGINNQKTESSRPTLLPVFRTRYVEGGQTTNLDSSADYIELRNTLLGRLGMTVTDYEQGLSEGNLDLISTDQFLQFAAKQKALAKQFQAPVADMEGMQQTTEAFKTMSDVVKNNILNMTNGTIRQLSEYLRQMGPNLPGHDLWLSALNDLEETKGVLEQKDEEDENQPGEQG